ncbi:hypothetical protein EWM64_g7365 [Hericium alpestre]|uniref:Acyl-protein thioesterase 1 n=1 Tax=Hericium alpestre TaxID=135208 RepID=A0A4Y9ZT30_9AGAM|nr:hypothetical protein EWM64_g7365 [Hericium alpestre]
MRLKRPVAKLTFMASALGLFTLGARRLLSTMPSTPPPALTVNALSKHTATVIFIHVRSPSLGARADRDTQGLGDTGDGWRPVADMFKSDPGLRHVKWVLPHSFDIISFGFDCEEDEPGMLRSAQSIKQLISAEIESGVPSERIVVGGFSQGAVMSILTGLTYEDKMAGIAVLSGWTPLRHKLKTMVPPHAASTPVFWGHGTHDPLVKYEFAVDSVEYLKTRIGLPATTLAAPDRNGLRGIAFNSYSCGHSTTEKELDDLKSWLKKVVPPEQN